MGTLAITIIPSVIILFYFIFSDKFREPKKLIIITFLFGVLATIPAGYLNHYILTIFGNNNIINNALLSGFFAGGFVEEILKFSVLYFYILKEKEFNEPMDAIVYGVVVSLGFATLENIEYVYFSNHLAEMSSREIAIIRSFSAIPLHALCGVIMGYYFGEYVFSNNGRFLGYSLIVPIIFHGTYNFLASFPNIYFLIVVLIALIFSIFLHKQAKIHQRFKIKEKELKNII